MPMYDVRCCGSRLGKLKCSMLYSIDFLYHAPPPPYSRCPFATAEIANNNNKKE